MQDGHLPLAWQADTGRSVTVRLPSPPQMLFKKAKVDYVKGHGTLTGANTLSVDLLEGGTQEITVRFIGCLLLK